MAQKILWWWFVVVVVYQVGFTLVSTETTESVASFYYQATSSRHSGDDPDKIEALFGRNLTISCPLVDMEPMETMSVNDDDELYRDWQQYPIYSIKWFKLTNATFYEFYSYIANPEQTIHHQSIPGIKLDLEETMTKQGQIVKLVDIDLDTEGIFQCEVIRDVTFQIERKQFELTVLIPAMEAPTILGTRQMYGIGERVQLRCITGASRPAPSIRWLINDIPVPKSYVIPLPSDKLPSSGDWQWQPSNDTLNNRHIDYEYSLLAINHPNQSSTNGVGHSNLSSPFESDSSSPAFSWSSHHPDLSAVNGNNLTNSSQPTNPTNLEHNSSQLDFKLRHEHLIDGGKRFSVQCVAFLDARFYPEAQHSEVNIDAWHEATPVLVGLRKVYALGDLVDINCTIPAFYSPDLSADKKTNVQGYESVQITWFINGLPANSAYVRQYFTYGNVGLRFRLQAYHLGADLSLSIRCKSVQKWPTHQLSQLRRLSLQTQQLYREPKQQSEPNSHFQQKQYRILLQDEVSDRTKSQTKSANSQTTTTTMTTTVINEPSEMEPQTDSTPTSVTTETDSTDSSDATTTTDQLKIEQLEQDNPQSVVTTVSVDNPELTTQIGKVISSTAVTPSVTVTNQLELTTNQNQKTNRIADQNSQNITTPLVNSTDEQDKSLFSIVKHITKTQPQVLRSFGFAMIPVAVMAVVFFVG